MAHWLDELGDSLKAPGTLTLIGSAGLLWHAHDRGVTVDIPEASMDVDPAQTVTKWPRIATRL